MITGITAIEATAFSVGDCPDCSELGLAFSSAESWERKNDLCCFYSSSIADGYSGRIYVCKYNSLSQAISDFESARKYRNPNRKITILKDSHTEFIFIAHDRTSPDIEIHGHFLDIEKQVRTKVIMEVDVPYKINNDDIEKAKDRFQAFAKCAHSMTGWKNVPVLSEPEEKYTLTLKHYPPYYESEKDKPWRAGDLVATLKDKSGNGVSGKRVFFYVDPGTKLDEVLVVRSGMIPVADYGDYVRPIIEGSYLGYACTDKGGVAGWNYILGRIKLDVLSNEIIDTGNVKGAITAVVFDEKTNKIEQKASIDVEFSSIAKIMKIRGSGVRDDPPIARAGVFSGPGQVRVFRKLNHSNFNLDTPQKEGFELMPADIINIDGDTSIEIVWVNGDRAILIVPKTVGVNEKQLRNNINFTLASTTYDYRGYEILSAIRSVTIEKGCNMLLDTVRDKILGETVGKGLGFVVDVIKKMGKDDNGVTKIGSSLFCMGNLIY